MNEIENKIEDLYLEHELHEVYEPKCSTCYSNALKLPEEKRVFLLIDNTLDLDKDRDEDHMDMELCEMCSIPCEHLYCDNCDSSLFEEEMSMQEN